MRTIGILLLVGFLFILALKSSVVALYTYWWFAIFRPHEWVYSNLSALKLPFVAFLLFFLSAVVNKKLPRINNPLSILLVLFLFFAILANTVNGCGNDPIYTNLRGVFELSLLLFVILMTAEFLTDRRAIFWFITVIAFSLAFHSGKGGLVAMVTGANYYGATQLSGFLTGSNAYAISTGFMLFYMIFVVQYTTKNNWALLFEDKKYGLVIKALKYLFILFVIGSFYNIIALQSRGSFIATSLGLLMLVAFQKNSLKYLSIAFVLISLILLTVPLPEGYKERISSAFAEEEELDNSATSRGHFWNVAKLIVEDHPLGTGPGCYPVYYNVYDTSDQKHGLYRSVHSSHFQVLSDTGYIGFLIWVFAFIYIYKTLWKIRKKSLTKMPENTEFKFYFDLSNVLMSIFTVFLIGGSFYEIATNDIIWVSFALVIALNRIFVKAFAEVK